MGVAAAVRTPTLRAGPIEDRVDEALEVAAMLRDDRVDGLAGAMSRSDEIALVAERRREHRAEDVSEAGGRELRPHAIQNSFGMVGQLLSHRK